MNKNIEIRQANVSDAEVLTSLAFQSKSYWGYSADFMEVCREELAVTINQIENENHHHYIGLVQGEIAGFYCLTNNTLDNIELDALFVKPEFISQGVGKALIEHAKNEARLLGASKMSIQGDPNAETFYLAMGAVKVSQSPSGI